MIDFKLFESNAKLCHPIIVVIWLCKIGMIKVFRKPEHIFIGGQHNHGIWDIQDIKKECSSYNINFRLMVPLILFGSPSIFLYGLGYITNDSSQYIMKGWKKTASEVKMQFSLMS